MKVVILAAGRGTQLGDLTSEQAKCMLPFGEETILHRQIRLLTNAGIALENITVVVGYQSAKIPKDKYNLIYNKDYYKTDNSYSLYLALKEVKEDVLILDGDLVFDENTLHLFLEKKGNCILCTKSNSEFGKTGVLASDSTHIVSEIGKHITNSEYQYMGIMRLEANVIPLFLDKLRQRPDMWYTVPLNEILKEINMFICLASGTIMGINTPFDYINAKKYFGIENFTILVTAASGFLGKKIYNNLKRKYTVIGTKYSSESSELFPLDLSNKDKVKAFFELNRPKIVINCAGIASPEICEQNREKAYKINVEAVKILCEICHQYGSKCIHISTDYVFDGTKKQEYKITDKPNPLNYYGYTKLEAEKIVTSYHDNLVVRIPIIYGYNDPYDKETFPQKVIKSLKLGHKIFLDNVQIRYPVLIDEVADIISKSLSDKGIIHISSSKGITKYEWALIIAKEFGYDQNLLYVDSSSQLRDRPLNVKLALSNPKYCSSDIIKGTKILKKQLCCVFKLIYSSHAVEHLYSLSVGEYRFKLGEMLGKSLPSEVLKDIDCIVPVPTSGLYYGMGMAKATNVPYIQALYKSDTTARSFQLESNLARSRLISAKILPISEFIKGKRIALIDEAIFTGTTLKVIVDMCKACGAKKIYICIPTPPCYNTCKQYIRPDCKLLSSYINQNSLKDYFKVEDVYFQPYQNFLNSLKTINDICVECFSELRKGVN